MPSWKVTRSASLVNKTSIFGIMGGLYNRKISGRSSMNRVTSRLEIPPSAAAGYKYMKLHNLLSRNPQGSGGVGRMFTAWPRGSGLGSHSATAAAPSSGSLESSVTDVGVDGPVLSIPGNICEKSGWWCPDDPTDTCCVNTCGGGDGGACCPADAPVCCDSGDGYGVGCCLANTTCDGSNNKQLPCVDASGNRTVKIDSHAGSPPEPKYKCDQDSGTCNIDPSGTAQTKATCDAACTQKEASVSLGATPDAAPGCCSSAGTPCYNAKNGACYGATPGGTCGANTVPCPCNAGSYRPPGTPAATVKCTDCPQGTYQDKSGQTSCTFCADGKHNDHTGSSSPAACVDCPAGSFSRPKDSGGPTGAYNIGCSDCPVGQYQPKKGQGFCSFCPKGTHQPLLKQTDASTCLACPAGQYQDTTGSQNCSFCLAGTYGPNPKATAASDCLACPKDTYQDQQKQTACIKCDTGTSTNGATGQTSKSACKVTTCSSGSYLDSSTHVCTLCPTGTYQSWAGESACLPCPGGTYGPNTGQISLDACKPCAPGSYQEMPGNTHPCEPCDSYGYQDESGATTCKPCPNGATSVMPRNSVHNCSSAPSSTY